MKNMGKINAAWAAALVEGLAAAGVEHAVISPGARSTSLTLACMRHAAITCHIVIDERSAGFFALGLAKAEGKPVAVICTSGSAVANWHPAVVEADMARAPLVLLSADRPPELQDCGAHQSIDQTRLFGPSLRAYHFLPPAEEDHSWLANFTARCVQQSLFPLPGPVQLNCAFREPLLAAPGDEPPLVTDSRKPRVVLPRQVPPAYEMRALAERLSGRKGVIVCGCEAVPPEPIVRLAAALNVPVLADPLSGLRFGSHDQSRLIVHYDVFLRGKGPQPDWVMRFGGYPMAKPYTKWLGEFPAAERIVVSGDSRWPDPDRAADLMIHGDVDLVADALAREVTHPASEDWVESFRSLDRAAAALIAKHAPPEAALGRSMIDSLPDGSLFFIGNSMSVRDFDAFSGTSKKSITMLANRGVAGIDGLSSTFLGATASGRYTAAAALIGDMSFLHDVGGLACAGKLNAVISVVDNGGGIIFRHQPSSTLPKHEFDAAWFTEQHADLQAAAGVYGHGHLRVEAKGFSATFGEALAQPGTQVVQVEVDPEESVARHKALWAEAAKLGTVSV